MLLARPHCRNSLQRLRKEALAPSFPGSLRTSRRALRPVLSSEDGNFSGQQTGLPVVFRTLLWQSARHEKHVELCDWSSLRDGTAEASRQWTPCDLKLCKLGAFAKIAVSPTRALAHVSFQQICIRAEARRGSFPPSSLQHQTGPP